MSALARFFAGKKILLTGHTGFKGAWLSALLKQLGADVVGYSLAAESDSLFAVAGLERDVAHVVGDVRDLLHIEEVIGARKPDVVLHLAAQSLVRRSYETPVDTFATNVMGTVNVLDACRRAKSVRAVVIVTTDKCYENREWRWPYREDDALGGRDPYSSSKAAAEIVTAAYRRSFFDEGRGAAVASARAGNVIGGGDWATDRIIPDIVRAIAAKRPAVIRNPQSVRPWQHVLDPLTGYLSLAQRLCEDPALAATAWNFGPNADEDMPVGELAQRFVAAVGAGALEIASTGGAPAPHEAVALRLDSSRARALLGWRPRHTLGDAVDLTAAWYRRWLDDPASARPTLLAQVASHVERLSREPQA